MPRQLTLKDHFFESRLFMNRSIVLLIMIGILLAILFSRLLYLQVYAHAHFTTLSEDNRVNLQAIAPNRGLIYDRNGVLLAQNRPAYSLEITPEQVGDLDQTLKQLAEVIEIDEEDLERFWKLKNRKRRFDSVPIRINLTPDEAALFAVHHHRLAGVEIKAQLLRHYPHGTKAAHVLGYVGRISQRDLD
ncbi:MAG: penicillin-binding protein 2, partial [Gammaproteobacteria bacterium]